MYAVLLDEPTTGLDIRSKREVQTFVRDLRDEHDASILLTTHVLDQAERLSARIVRCRPDRRRDGVMLASFMEQPVP